ncbi:MAG TPA: HAD family hydrolase [Methanocella sp.]|uniref:HAD family hydrolase n=1 Tax=Methanocella sp. TaxID=2052833 RepID=UPI002CDA594E|nr:HAD family hydrolase [Methanocella sp.]HTY89566.1 HAD family hydrolase [Methanocella sp.]
MAIKLVISDFDRTFTDESLSVAPELKEAIGLIGAKGIRFSIVSGRNYGFLLEFCRELDGLLDSFVAENGCIGHFKGKKCVLGDSARRGELLGRLKQLGVPYGQGEVIVAVEARYQPQLCKALSGLDGAFHVIRNVDSLMILPAGISKSSGAAWLARMYGVQLSETAAIGDAQNDVAFRDSCVLLGAVSNAIPEMKATADYVCRQSYGKGLQEFIEYIGR